ncbi:unnamed protein product [Paramecium pentaurelia]|uniref:Ribosomal RNA methyltransferase FtsJ domain-containing protein n=1 Tax=Paramecium pentaurelia TaxID=43138 RepID=A0A8S1U2X8_9CILI|nr:unnamed protein product [Paramecium pentaurelia]
MLKLKNLYSFSVSSQKKTKRWYMEHINDFYVKESKRLQLRSRAAFKLMQIDEKYKIYKSNQYVLDLGAAPGSWSQVVSEKCKVVAIDLLEVLPIQNVKFIQGDIMDKSIMKQIRNHKFDVVLSDMAPNVSGEHEADHQGITTLNQIALLLSTFTLKTDGNLVMKTFVGSEEKLNYDFFRLFFKEFYREKPLSSKQESSELFYIGKGFSSDLIKQILENTEKLYQYPEQIQSRLKNLIIDYKMFE